MTPESEQLIKEIDEALARSKSLREEAKRMFYL